MIGLSVLLPSRDVIRDESVMVSISSSLATAITAEQVGSFNSFIVTCRLREGNGGSNYGSPNYLAYHLKNVMIFHLYISLWNNIFNILSPNLDIVLTWIVNTFYEPILTKFIYKDRFIPNTFLINSLGGDSSYYSSLLKLVPGFNTTTIHI